MSDPLDLWPVYASQVRARLEQGRKTYGDKSFSLSPAQLRQEIGQEALDCGGWGFILWTATQQPPGAVTRLPTPIRPPWGLGLSIAIAFFLAGLGLGLIL